MKRSEIKVGREYVVKVGGRYGFTARETVTEIVGKIFFTRGGYGEKCRRLSRNFVKAVELTQEQKMNTIVAFIDGAVPTGVIFAEFANSPVDVGSAHVSEFRLRQEYQRLHAEKPAVVAYTEDGLPLTVAAAKTLVKVCDETRGDTRLVVSRPETPAERIARVHAEAMARS